MSDELLQATINAEPLRFSRLKRMAQSPAHYAAAVEQSTSAMSIGNAADVLILGGSVLAYPGAVRRGKEWEAWRDAQEPGALIVTQKELAAAQGMARAVAMHEEATRLLTGTIRETLYWTLDGRSCRGTPDAFGPNHLTDLKTSETSDPRRFPWKVRQYAYHAQLAWYRQGLALTGHPVPEAAYIVAVEQTPPHVVTVFRLTEHVLDLGARLCRLWFEQLRVCEASGQFPGYALSPVELDLPDDDSDVLIEIGAAGEATE